MNDDAYLAVIGREVQGVKIDEAPEYAADCVALIGWFDSLLIAGEKGSALLELDKDTISKLKQVRCLARQGVSSRFDADYYSGRWMG